MSGSFNRKSAADGPFDMHLSVPLLARAE